MYKVSIFVVFIWGTSNVHAVDLRDLDSVSGQASLLACAVILSECQCNSNVGGNLAACQKVLRHFKHFEPTRSWVNGFIGDTGSARTACFANKVAKKIVPGGQKGLWDAVGVADPHWRRNQDVCWDK